MRGNPKPFSSSICSSYLIYDAIHDIEGVITCWIYFFSYFPCPVVSLRTCKAPLIIGLAEGQAEELGKVSKDWCVSGMYGIIQVCDRESRPVEVVATKSGFSVKYKNS
mmetsp:Transcript_5442/g.9111  ORF Transcript_5442/g.9111 Transcript_5442/m.9111 type:complete len:108 (+) Transcript_5442:1491-1814(+)